MESQTLCVSTGRRRTRQKQETEDIPHSTAFTGDAVRRRSVVVKSSQEVYLSGISHELQGHCTVG